MREFLSIYSEKHRDMNEDLIRNFRLKDNMVEKIEEMCKEIAKILHENVTYLGVNFDDSRSRFREANTSSKKRDSKTGKLENAQYINVNYTYSRMAIFHFRIKFQDPRTNDVTLTKCDMPIYIPQFKDDYHYFIRGNNYSCPWQCIDSVCYRGRDDSIVLKTLIRAIKLSRQPVSIVDAHGLPYKTHLFYMHVSKKKIPFLLYYFSFYGFYKTLQYFGVDKWIKVYEEAPIEPSENTIFFKYGKFFLGVNRDAFNTYHSLKEYVATTLALGRKNLNIRDTQDVYYWMRTLGAYISQTKPYEQGASLLTTFITCLDARTILNIQKTVGGFKKDNPWIVLKWMFLDYLILSKKNMGASNKRLRYTEYLITPLVRDVQMKLYRFLKTRAKMRDLKRLTDIFHSSPSIICNSIIGKVKNKSMSLNIAKYSNQTSDLVLLSALDYSKSGPGSPFERVAAKRAGSSLRAMDASYLSKIDLISGSSVNCGISGTLSPFAKVNEDTFMFED